MGILETGITGLNAFRSQLTTTSHNIANVNTEGYSRQIVGLGTLPATNTRIGSIGNGVQVTEIRRQFDQFLMDRLRTYTSSDADYQVFFNRASRVADLIADPDAGLSGAMQGFFNSVQDVADNPTSSSTRDVLLSNANILVDRFNTMHDFLEGLRTEINQDMEVLVGEANTFTESIADLNAQIQLFVNGSGGQTPNDLLDRRDQVITELSELVNITTVEQDDGTVNVFMGNGQGVVIGTRSFQLSTQVNSAEVDRLDITLEGGGGSVGIVTNFLNGGKIGGYLRFRDEILDPTENGIGRMALGLGTLFNEQHQLGMDLNGALGKDFFYLPDYLTPDGNGAQMLLEVQTGGTPASISNIDVAELDTADFEVSTADGINWTIYNRETGATSTKTAPGNLLTFGGLNDVAIEMDVTGAAANDSYIVRPTRIVGRAIDVQILDGREVAAASPVSVSEGVQTGTAEVSSYGLLTRDPANTLLAAPVTLTFSTPPDQFNYPGGPAAYTSGQEMTITIAGLGDFGLTINGSPAAGDTFILDTNSDNTGNPIGIGDNRNALRLAALQTAKTMRNDSTTSANPTSSFVNLYSSLIGEVGAETRQALISSNTQARLKEQAETALDEVVGVNLDEEAAKLVSFQQAYQASAQVIRVSNQLFDSLLNSF
jgi:flagellar hook-associated protein 1 FlgK